MKIEVQNLEKKFNNFLAVNKINFIIADVATIDTKLAYRY